MTALRPPKCTKDQRDRILKLMQKAEFDTQTVSLMHTRIRAARTDVGKPVDAWLDTVDMLQAADIIFTLEEILA